MNKRYLLKLGLASLPALALFLHPVVADESIHFSSCKEAWENGYADIHKGEPGYSATLDKDHDGIACESKNAPKGVLKEKKTSASQANNNVSSDSVASKSEEPTSSVATVSGWVRQNGSWYYFSKNGKPVTNTWQGAYYLKSDGRMAENEWVYDNYYQAWYYLKSDGS
ncbi:excalibur calcium-binding domain-containing protein, partial [Streptococcus sp. HMSC062D07]